MTTVIYQHNFKVGCIAVNGVLHFGRQCRLCFRSYRDPIHNTVGGQ